MRVSFEPRSTISCYNATFTAPPKRVPSNKVVDGPIIGNGDVGVTVSGVPELQRFWLSKNDFWKAKRTYPNGSPCLLGGIDISIPAMEGASYYAEQRMYEAELFFSFRSEHSTVSIRAWVSAMENMLVMEMSCDGQPILVKASLWTQSEHESVTESGQDGNLVWATRAFTDLELDWPTEGAAAMRWLTGHGNEFVLEPGKKEVVVAFILTNHDREDYLNEALRRTASLDGTTLSSIRFEHDNWWHRFWANSFIEIGDDLLERFWYGSHYIMACCSRNKQFPPGLLGNWITTDTPAWASDYHMNYNYQAPWWGVYSSNHIELSEPYDTPVMQYVPNGRHYALTYLGCRGVYYDVGIGPKGLPTALCDTPYEDGHMFCGQKSNASYCAVNMLMRYYHTYDLQYAERVAYPYLVEVANFWEDYLKFEDNRYVIYRDSVREVEVWTEEHANDDWAAEFEDMNPIVSLGLIRAVMKGVLDISAELGVDTDRRAKWSHILEHISAFPTIEREGKMVFRLTEKGYSWGTNNSLEVQHIYPAGAIGLSSDPKLIEIAKNTLTAMNRWTDYNGFPTIFTAAARVGYDPAVILEQLRYQCKEHSFPNLFIFFGGGGIECCSGVPSTINEMLLQSHEHVLRLFPVWPRGKNARFEHLRAVGAFLVSSELVDDEVVYVEIESEKGKVCRMISPWENKRICVIEVNHDGQEQSVVYDAVDHTITFPTETGKRYKVMPKFF